MTTVAELIEFEAADLLVIAQAMCRAEVAAGAAPCSCSRDATKCCALDVFGDQARAVRQALADEGRLQGAARVHTLEETLALFGEKRDRLQLVDVDDQDTRP